MGSEMLATGSIVAAFFAGSLALFAPCCIVFLAPSYVAAAARNRRWRLLPLTFLFALGLGAVLLPITLGMSLLAGAIARYHTVLYVAGGAVMLLLAGLSLTGRMWSLPSFLRAPDTSRGDSASFLVLGVFSGVASSCCAPVLAGVMTLSALSGSAVGGLLLGVAYVFGMTFPLFVIALVWDKAGLADRRALRARPITLAWGRHRLVTNTVNLLVAVAFTVMGVLVLAVANSDTMTRGTDAQVAAGAWLSEQLSSLLGWLAPVPEPVLGAALLALAVGFVLVALRDRRHRPEHQTDGDAEDHACHDHPTTPAELSGEQP